MNDIKPINEEVKEKTIEQTKDFKPIVDNNNLEEVTLPNLKKSSVQEEMITRLPEWSIEPPIEIKRG